MYKAEQAKKNTEASVQKFNELVKSVENEIKRSSEDRTKKESERCECKVIILNENFVAPLTEELAANGYKVLVSSKKSNELTISWK